MQWCADTCGKAWAWQQPRQAVCDELGPQLAASDLEQLQLLLPHRFDCKDSCSRCCCQSDLA